MASDDLQTRTGAVGSNTSSSTSRQDCSGSGLGVFWKLIGVQERRMCDNGQNLTDEGDWLVSHGVSVTNVGLDNIGKWFLDTSLNFLVNLFSIKTINYDHCTFSIAVARMTKGPLTAYSIFLMQGFMLSKVTVAGAMAVLFRLLVDKFLQETRNFCLKLSILKLNYLPSQHLKTDYKL